MAAFTCKGCTERNVGCHESCEKYIREKAAYNDRKEKERQDRMLDEYDNDKIFKRRYTLLKKYGKSNI